MVVARFLPLSAVVVPVAMLVFVAACGGVATSDPAPTRAPSSTVSPLVAAPAPDPSAAEPTVTIDLPAAEAYLLAGVRADAAVDCAPRRDELPARAIAGVECQGSHPVVDRVGFYLFASEPDLLATYTERLEAAGVPMDAGGCFGGAVGDTNYVPEGPDGPGPYRHGCFINEEGRGNYRATLPDSLVYVGVLGTTGDTDALREWAWFGNMDQPGGPTIWRHLGPG